MYIDIFIIVVALWAIINGWRNGFFKELVSGIGWLVGLAIAATCYSYLGEYLVMKGSEANIVTNIVAFFILWILVPIVLGLVATILTSALNGLQLGLPNSLLGAAVSLLKYAILISCVLNVMSALRILNESRTEGSKLFEPTKAMVSVLFNTFGQPNGQDSERASEKLPADFQPGDTLWVDMHKSQEK